MVKVSVIVLNWNGIEDTLKCIASLKKQSFKDFEIIVVDNGSTKDDSVSILKKQKGIRVVYNEKNEGFAGGNNAGANASRATDYIALLNNDATAEKDWLKELVRALDENPRLGQATSKMFHKYGAKDYEFPYYGTSTLVLQQAAYDRIVNEKKLVPISAAGGGGMIYRVSVAKIPFDPLYFIYHEDSAFGLYMHVLGFDSAVVPTSLAYHEGEATIKRETTIRSRFLFLAERNRNLNLLFYYQFSTLIKLIPIYAISFALLHLAQPRLIPIRLRSYFWILSNLPLVLSKRKRIQKQRAAKDATFTRFYSSKIIEPRHLSPSLRPFAKILNGFSRIYCKLVMLPVIENEWDNVMKNNNL